MTDNSLVRQKINSMTFPIIIENILHLALGLVSMSMIGRISIISVAAQGVCILLTGITWSLLKGISVGISVLIANAYGSKDKNKIKLIAWQGFITLLLFSSIVMLFVYLNSRTLLLLFDPQPNLLEDSLDYLKIVVFGFPFVAVVLCVTGILQGMGDAKMPAFVAIIMNISNILLGYILIFGKFDFSPGGLPGAALALVISQGIGALSGLFILFRKKGILYDIPIASLFRLDYNIIKRIFKIGLPTGMESSFWQISSVILSRIILSFGEVPFAAYQFGIQAEAIAEMPALGFGVAATTFTGQSLGALDKERGRHYLRETSKGAILVIAFGSITLLFFPDIIMRLFTDDQMVIKLGVIYIRLAALVQFPQNMQKIFNGALIGAGYTRIPMLIAGVGIWGFRIPMCLILTNYFNYGIISIWLVICIDQVLRFIVSYIIFKKKRIFNR